MTQERQKADVIKEMDKCEDCLAYYPKSFNHVCPPWLKELVTMHKKKQAHEHKQTRHTTL